MFTDVPNVMLFLRNNQAALVCNARIATLSGAGFVAQISKHLHIQCLCYHVNWPT